MAKSYYENKTSQPETAVVKTEPVQRINAATSSKRGGRTTGGSGSGQRYQRRSNQPRGPHQAEGSTQRYCSVCEPHDHVPAECRYRTYFCNVCNKKGHLANVCRNKNIRKRSNFLVANVNENDVENETNELQIFNIKSSK